MKKLKAKYSCINRFTSLSKNLSNLLEFLAEVFDAMCIIFNASPGPSSIENDADGVEKTSAKSSNKLNKFLHSEVNLLILHIIVQDQDGQNNNKI